jgi:hypothetical protein
MGRLLDADEVAEWKSGWAAARRKHTGYVPCFYCEPVCGFDRLHGHVQTTHQKSLPDFRRDFGLNQNSRLASVRFSELMAAKRGRALARSGRATRFTKGKRGRAASLVGVTARKVIPTTIETRRNISAAHRGRTQPKLRKADRLGRTIPSWAVVEPRLRGLETRMIAEVLSKKYGIGITAGAVVARLRTIGLTPGKPARFDRGRTVTEQRLISHWEDFQFVRGGKLLSASAARAKRESEQEVGVKEASSLLKVSEAWVYDRCRPTSGSRIPHRKDGTRLLFRRAELLEWAAVMQHGKSNLRPRGRALRELAGRLDIGVHRLRELIIQGGGPSSRRRRGEHRKFGWPLSLKLAGRLLDLAEPQLKKELQSVGATDKGGSPEVLLPSEKRAIPGEYDTLMGDCERLIDWAKAQTGPVTMESVGEWMCDQTGPRVVEVLLFWPKLHGQLPDICERYRTQIRGELSLSDRVKEWLADEHHCSVPTIERAVAAGRRSAEATA